VFAGRAPRTVPAVAVFGKDGALQQSRFVVPVAILREAGLPHTYGGAINLLVGSGSDAGCIAIVAGDQLKLSRCGKSGRLLQFCTARIGVTSAFGTRECRYEVGRGQLIFTLPSDFPWSSAEAAPAASNRELEAA
jgi:hypothetical protein